MTGPKITLNMSCYGCSHCRSVGYEVQSDSGHDVYCDHPERNGKKIGDTFWNTPSWCPVFPAEAQERLIATISESFTAPPPSAAETGGQA